LSKQTDKSRYPSRYSPGKFITEAQYILELVCEKKAKVDKKELPIHFWDLPEWQAFFKMQLRRVHTLLKKYDMKAILAAINKCWKLYSILPAWFEQKVKEEQSVLEKMPIIDSFEPINRNIEKTGADRVVPTNIKDKIMGLDD